MAAAGCPGTQLPEALHQFPGAHWLSLAHETGQLSRVPLQTYGMQEGEPPKVDDGVQVPLAEAPSATAQTSHAPPQAVSQQKPSAQYPDAHWRPSAHDVPISCAATQTPPSQ